MTAELTEAVPPTETLNSEAQKGRAELARQGSLAERNLPRGVPVVAARKAARAAAEAAAAANERRGAAESEETAEETVNGNHVEDDDDAVGLHVGVGTGLSLMSARLTDKIHAHLHHRQPLEIRS